MNSSSRLADFSLAGKRAIVTGGSKGIGAAIAVAFAQYGADVVIGARGREALEQTAAEIAQTGRRGLPVVMDILNDADLERIVDTAVRELGGVDVLVNNAMVRIRGALAAISREDWDTTMQGTLWSAFRLSQLCYPLMKERWGSIINITSNEGLRYTNGLSPIYAIGKAAMVHMTRVCASEWAQDKVRVNCIAPGLIRTELTERLCKVYEDAGTTPGPLGYIGGPEEIAGIAVYLASDASRYMTGETMAVDGGEMFYVPLPSTYTGARDSRQPATS